MTVSSRLRSLHGRREFLGTAAFGLAGAVSQGACRSRATAGQVVLRLSHSMAAGATALHVMADAFRESAERKTAATPE